ncbi:MAG: putative lipoic acid-binding regulatory protein [Arcobacteraceae bacterium]|jgi:putative lipoic acid-binding regulatory protein
MIDLNQHKLELDYPCNWSYKIVIRYEQDIKLIINEVLDERLHVINPSKTSRQGKFKSFNLDLVVHNEEDRKALYQLLGDHEHIKMVV